MVSNYDVRGETGLNHILWLKCHIARRAGKVVLTVQSEINKYIFIKSNMIYLFYVYDTIISGPKDKFI